MDRVLSLIENYGYLVILFGVMLESTGVPLPGETYSSPPVSWSIGGTSTWETS